MNLGEEIRLTRQKALYTQEDFANKLNVALSTINRWELSKSLPNITAMNKIKMFCETHGLPFDAIENAWLCEKKTEARK